MTWCGPDPLNCAGGGGVDVVAVGLRRELTDLAGGGGRVWPPMGMPSSGGRGTLPTPAMGWIGRNVVAVVVKVRTCGGWGTKDPPPPGFEGGGLAMFNWGWVVKSSWNMAVNQSLFFK